MTTNNNLISFVRRENCLTVDVDGRVAEGPDSLLRVEGVRLQVEDVELIRAVVELLLEVVEDEGEVCGGSPLYVEVDVVTRVLSTEQRILP